MKHKWRCKNIYRCVGGNSKTYSSGHFIRKIYGFHNTDVQSIAKVCTRPSGEAHTAFAIVEFRFSTTYTGYKYFLYRLKKHFRGFNANRTARKWCEYLMENPPNYFDDCGMIKEDE